MGKSPTPWGVTLQYAGIAVSNLCKRDDVVIATKFLPRTPEDIEAGITGQQHIEKMLDKSLENLGMDYAAPLYDIMEGLNNAVNAGKVRYIGISNCFAYQLAKANALAGGRLAKHPGETSKRFQEDSYAHLKYDATAEFAKKHGVSMTEISLAWLLTKVDAPVVGVTRLAHIEGAAKAVDLSLSSSEIAYLEELYIPHKLVGVMAQNTAAAAKEKHVWSVGSQKI